MTALRDQLDAAKRQYRCARYPGDLGQLLVRRPADEVYTPHPVLAGIVLAAAASVLIVVGAPLLKSNSRALAKTTAGERQKITCAMGDLGPIEPPSWLTRVGQPLVASGHFIVSVGKDLAHHADALIHMG